MKNSFLLILPFLFIEVATFGASDNKAFIKNETAALIAFKSLYIFLT